MICRGTSDTTIIDECSYRLVVVGAFADQMGLVLSSRMTLDELRDTAGKYCYFVSTIFPQVEICGLGKLGTDSS